MAQNYKITVGSKYLVRFRVSVDVAESFTGVYRGMSVIGTDTSLVFEVDGRTRFLMASSVFLLDELEAAVEEPETKSEPSSVYYG